MSGAQCVLPCCSTGIAKNAVCGWIETFAACVRKEVVGETPSSAENPSPACGRGLG